MKKIILSIAIMSIPFLNAQVTSPTPYCLANYDQPVFSVPDAVYSVSLGTLLNNTNARFAFPHYVFYNNLAVPNLAKGTSYPIALKFNVQGSAGYGVWIDYNQNNIFETNEKIIGTSATALPISMGGTTNVTNNITIPPTALVGTTRMRVRIAEDLSTIGNPPNGYYIFPCNQGTTPNDIVDSGETEDYAINITSNLANNNVPEIENMTIYPNPVDNSLTFIQNYFDEVNYKIYNLLGLLIQSGSIYKSENEISVSSLSDGIYFMQLFENEKYLGQKKFIKKD
jgi:GEVED domain/Secretion system C-terminal sorting domain